MGVGKGTNPNPRPRPALYIDPTSEFKFLRLRRPMGFQHLSSVFYGAETVWALA